MQKWNRIGVATLAVVASLVGLFLVPRQYFVAGTIAATSVMIAGALLLRENKPWSSLSASSIGKGLVSAAVLYGIFFAGNLAIHQTSILGGGSGQEASIYSLISTPGNPTVLQVAILAFDSVGYESFFRGVLQRRAQKRVGVWGAPLVALLDAGVHVATLNPLWVVTTFIADSVWGLTFYYGKGLQSSLTSHMAWDLAIFIIRPIV